LGEICKTVRPMLSHCCLSWLSLCPVCPVLSLTFVHCGQTVGGINMKLGMLVGLGPGHTVRWGPTFPSPKWHRFPQFSSHICCGQINGCMDQYVTWYGGRPRPRSHCTRRGSQLPRKRKYCCLTSVFPIVDTCLSCEDMARQSCAMVPIWRFFASCICSQPLAAHFRPAF